MRKDLSIYAIITAAVAVIVMLSIWPYMWEGEFLGKWSSVVTILSVVGSITAYFVKQGEKEREQKQAEIMEKIRAARNLHGELDDTLRAIKGDKFPQDLLDVTIGKKKITFVNRFLNHHIYDSLVFSGDIKFLDYEIHQIIQDIFNMIKYHNHYLVLIIENKNRDGQISDVTLTYYELLEKYEQKLLKKIPDIKEQLEKRFEPLHIS